MYNVYKFRNKKRAEVGTPMQPGLSIVRLYCTTRVYYVVSRTYTSHKRKRTHTARETNSGRFFLFVARENPIKPQARASMTILINEKATTEK